MHTDSGPTHKITVAASDLFLRPRLACALIRTWPVETRHRLTCVLRNRGMRGEVAMLQIKVLWTEGQASAGLLQDLVLTGVVERLLAWHAVAALGCARERYSFGRGKALLVSKDHCPALDTGSWLLFLWACAIGTSNRVGIWVLFSGKGAAGQISGEWHAPFSLQSWFMS